MTTDYVATLTVVVGYCGSGKSHQLREYRRQHPDAVVLEEGFWFSLHEHNRKETDDAVSALVAGRDCFVGLFECLAVAARAQLVLGLNHRAPGTTINWVFFENDVGKANRNCMNDPQRDERRWRGNIIQNNAAAPFYSIPSDAVVREMVELPPRSASSGCA